ncbi:MAG: hypothetical protein E7417_06620 [Ruminococcaceae bacterium]|nr:hypothetical protein [Oscillospiraceae bacterium]
MKKSNVQLIGFVFSGVLGVLLHFLYSLTGDSPFVALFSAVNESTWEHMKIAFFPMLIFAIVERRFFLHDSENYWCIKLSGIGLATLLIPVLFYTLNGAYGKTSAFVNILIFFASIYIGYKLETRFFNKGICDYISERAAIFFLCIIAIAFAVFTFFSPELPLFLDPVNGGYGI